MSKDINTENIVKTIVDFMNEVRENNSFSEIHIPVVYVLYGKHKKYAPFGFGDYWRYDHEGDEILDDLYDYASMISENLYFPYHSLYDLIDTYSYEVFEGNYVDILNSLNDEVSKRSERSEGDFYTPKEISGLISYFINKEGCKSVYDPFCGTANIIHYLDAPDNEIVFKGQDYSIPVSILARVIVEARLGSDDSIDCADSIETWSKDHFDAVCSCPPMNLKISLHDGVEKSSPRVTIEELFIDRAFNFNSAKVAIILVPLSFSYREGYERNVRKRLVSENLIDTVVLLPSNLLYGVSMPCFLLVCKKGRQDKETINFINAEKLFEGDSRKNRLFDYNTFVEIADAKDPEYCYHVSTDDIIYYDYNINPCLYKNKVFVLKKGQKVYKISDLINLEEGIRASLAPNDGVVVPAVMGTSFVKVLLNTNKTVKISKPKDGFRYKVYEPIPGKHYLVVSSMVGTIRYALMDTDRFYCEAGLKVFSINENIVSPKYLVYLLLSNTTICDSHMSLQALGKLLVVVDKMDDQINKVNSLIIEHDNRARRIQEIEAKRLGVKQNISDLEHMLGSTQQKVNNIIDRLSRITPDNDRYPIIVKQLKDNVEYMNRIIHYNNASIESESFNIVELDFESYLDNYMSAWINYGGNYFRLIKANYIESNYTVCFDKALFTVMFDSILSNAVRHGFKKKKDFTSDNKVEIGLSLEKFKDKAYLVIRVANNGDPISDDFTINDYITKGRYSSLTGRSGLGGYHVYQIVQGHQGFLYLDSNKIWSVIVEILIPVTKVETDKLIEYEHECI